MISKGDQDLPVFACVCVDYSGDFILGYRLPRVVHQPLVQNPFSGTGLGRWHDFGPCQVSFEEFVCDQQPACVVAIKEMMTARKPKVSLTTHGSFSRPIVSRSTCSAAGSSSPETSRNA